MLYISGFEYNGKTYSGAELQKDMKRIMENYIN